MKNKYFLFLIASLFFFQTTSFGQIRWSAGIDVDFLQDAQVDGSKKVTDTRYFYTYTDSLKQTYEDTRDIDLYNSYSPSGKGLKLYGQAHIAIGKKFELVTGLGLDYNVFYINTIYTAIDLQENLISSIKVDSIPPDNLWNLNYPEYKTNDSWGRSDEVTIVNLYIPVALDFEVTENFRLFAGGKLNTPVYSKYNSYQDEIGDIVIHDLGPDSQYYSYSSGAKVIKDTSGDAMRRISIEGFGGVKYRFLDRYELSVSASQSFTSITRSPEKNTEKDIYQKVDFQSFKPVKYSVGVSYFFN